MAWFPVSCTDSRVHLHDPCEWRLSFLDRSVACDWWLLISTRRSQRQYTRIWAYLAEWTNIRANHTSILLSCWFVFRFVAVQTKYRLWRHSDPSLSILLHVWGYSDLRLCKHCWCKHYTKVANKCPTSKQRNLPNKYGNSGVVSATRHRLPDNWFIQDWSEHRQHVDRGTRPNHKHDWCG